MRRGLRCLGLGIALALPSPGLAQTPELDAVSACLGEVLQSGAVRGPVSYTARREAGRFVLKFGRRSNLTKAQQQALAACATARLRERG